MSIAPHVLSTTYHYKKKLCLNLFSQIGNVSSPTRVKAERQRETKSSRSNNGHTGANLDFIVGFLATDIGGQCVLHPSSITRLYCRFLQNFQLRQRQRPSFRSVPAVSDYIRGLPSQEYYSEHCTCHLSGAYPTTNQIIQGTKCL
jgi:hypothetical protein